MTPHEEKDHSPRSPVPRELTSYSTPVAFTYGTGLSLYKSLLLPAILNAKHEIILTTCFWAASATLDELVSTLKQLSAKVVVEGRVDAAPIKVYICFSSRSATQKLFHTSSPDGFVYPDDKWPRKLGLPSSRELPGLDIAVKSLFFRPFSVLHSKYIIVDRQTVFLPSCNVSWEDWYECVVGFDGPIVRHVFDFWKDIWRPAGLSDSLNESPTTDDASLTPSPTGRVATLPRQSLRTTLLPHPHNSSLRQSLWFMPNSVAPLPITPLNQTLLHLLTNAKDEVILLTPNFTSHSAFTAICLALTNGVHIHLITDRHMMVPEQLATAGAVTEQFVDRLVKETQRNFSGGKIKKRLVKLRQSMGQLPLSKPARQCRLKISYFCPPQQIPQSLQTIDHSPTSSTGAGTGSGIASYATKSHIKLTLIDRKAIVLGSGNMDRASWRTSQELGVLIEDVTELGNSTSFVENMWREVEKGLEGCLETYFEG